MCDANAKQSQERYSQTVGLHQDETGQLKSVGYQISRAEQLEKQAYMFKERAEIAEKAAKFFRAHPEFEEFMRLQRTGAFDY